jgi:hypothetical protein
MSADFERRYVMSGKLTVFMVGTLAAVLKKTRPADKFPIGVRILLPFAPQHISRFDNSVVIPRTEPFIAVPWNAIKNHDKPTPMFRRRKLLPVMEGEDFGDAVDMAYFALSRKKTTKIDFESPTPFTPIDGAIGDKPTKETGPYLSWVANMTDYSPDNEVVDKKYMNDVLPDDESAAAVEFDRGTFSVGSVGFDHQFRFINGPDGFDRSIAPTDSFDRTIADALKLSADLETPRVTVTIDGDIVLELDGEDLSFLIGSEPLTHAFFEPPQPCGTPFFHHEILYQFSESRPHDSDIVVPVCIDVPNGGGRDPEYGRCVPPVFMTAPARLSENLLRSMEIQTPRALSLHMGVNEFSPSFQSSTSLPTPRTLDSCVRDATAMRDFAATLGFQSLNNNGQNVLADTEATVSGLTTALKDYGQAAGPGSFFLLTFSGHGMPMQFRGGGWCLNTNVLLYSELKKFLGQYFNKAARIMVISDCCHSGNLEKSTAGVKELPMRYAEAFFNEEFGPLTFGERFISLTLTDKARPEESAQPTMYFVFACGNEETISDGGKKHLSPFTNCVLAHPHDPTVPAFEAALAACGKKSSHIVKLPSADQIWDLSEPFSMPPPPTEAQRAKTR